MIPPRPEVPGARRKDMHCVAGLAGVLRPSGGLLQNRSGAGGTWITCHREDPGGLLDRRASKDCRPAIHPGGQT